MAALAAGDQAFVVALYEAFGHEVRTAARYACRRCGILRPDPQLVDDVAFEFCWSMAGRAPHWDPGGALPWVWGRRLLIGLAAVAAGAPRAELPADDVFEAQPSYSYAGPDDEDPLDLLQRLGAHHPSCELLGRALDEVGVTARDARLTLLHEMQVLAGDPSPSHTLATHFGLSRTAVRKAVSRTRGRIRALAASDDRFAPLLALGLVSRERAA
jgi:DNA-directed RNA polymerase specialized sigma24 family protein